MRSISNLTAVTLISAALMCPALPGCGDSSPAESDSATVMDQAVVDQSATDQAATDQTVPDQTVPDQTRADKGSCPKSKPNGYCTTVGAGPCLYPPQKCRCESVCSGRKPPPGKEYAWNCQSDACPDATPKTGATCSKEALKCEYSCTTATCTSGKWSVKTLTPP